MSGSFFAIYTMNGLSQTEERVARSQRGVEDDYFWKQWN
jgi:hypothetical protein